MKNRKKIAIAVVLTLVFAGTLAGAGGVAGTPGVVTRPWVNADGIVDVTKMPRLQGVVDRTGAHVGFVETRYTHGDDFVHPHPVIDADGNLIGAYWRKRILVIGRRGAGHRRRFYGHRRIRRER